MSETLLYTIAGVLYTISLEFFVLFFMISFQALPGKLFFSSKKNCARIFVCLSLSAGLAGGYLCYIADGYFEPFQLWTAFFPALFVPFLIAGFFSGSDMESDTVVLHMRAGTYTLNTETARVGTQLTAVNYAVWGNKVVRFTGAVPSSPISIRAYCRKARKIPQHNTYSCSFFYAAAHNTHVSLV